MVLTLDSQIRFNPGVNIDIYRTQDNHLIETVIFSGSKYHKNLISITNQIGCSVKCSHCIIGEGKYIRNISSEEYLQQVQEVINNSSSIHWYDKKPLKVCFNRAGEPLLNLNTFEGLVKIADKYNPSFQLVSVMPDTKISKILLNQIKEYLINYNQSFQINISMHNSDEIKRKQMMPYSKLMSFENIVKFAENWVRDIPERKINLSYLLIENNEIDLKEIRNKFSPEHFAIRLALYLPSSKETAKRHPPSNTTRMNELAQKARDYGYTCIESRPAQVEIEQDTRPGSGLKILRQQEIFLNQ